jgi:hypothetical protein
VTLSCSVSLVTHNRLDMRSFVQSSAFPSFVVPASVGTTTTTSSTLLDSNDVHHCPPFGCHPTSVRDEAHFKSSSPLLRLIPFSTFATIPCCFHPRRGITSLRQFRKDGKTLRLGDILVPLDSSSGFAMRNTSLPI